MPTVLFGFDDEVLIKSSEIATSLRRMILRCETEYPGPLRKWRRDYEAKHPPPNNAAPKMALRVQLPFSNLTYSSSSQVVDENNNNKKPITRVFVSPVAQQDVWESTINDLLVGGKLVVAEVVFVVWNEVLEDLQAISTNLREFVPSSSLLHEMNADKIAKAKEEETQQQQRLREDDDAGEGSSTGNNSRKHAVHHQDSSPPPPQSVPRLAIPSTISASKRRTFGATTQESSWLKNRNVETAEQQNQDDDYNNNNKASNSNNIADPNRRSSIVSRLRSMEDNNISVQLDDNTTTSGTGHQVSSIKQDDDYGENGSFLKREDDDGDMEENNDNNYGGHSYDRNEVPLYSIPVPTHVIVAVGITLNPPVITLLFQNPPKDVLSAGEEERSLFTEEDMRLLETNILDRCVPGHQVFSGGMRAARQLQQQQQSAAGVNTSNSPSRNPFRFVRVHREDTSQTEARSVFGNFKTIRQRQQASQQALRVASQEHWEMHLQQLHFNDVQEALLYCAIADTMEVLGANRLVPHDGSSVLNNTIHAQGVDSRMAMLRGSMASTTANAQYIGGSGVGGGGNVEMKTHCQIFFFFPIVGHS